VEATVSVDEAFTMRRVLALLGFGAFVVAGTASFTLPPNGSSRASSTKAAETFLIPASDGYGVADCLAGGNLDCGRVIAAAWCEAQGFARAESFGPAMAEDHTGSVEARKARAGRDEAQPVAITCAN
jgi:hypothetical protein